MGRWTEAARTVLPNWAKNAIMSGLGRNDLRWMARRYGTDKWGVHRYADHYQTHLGHLKRCRFNLLEIGVGGYDLPDQGGASLRMWKAFFPRANIFAIDIFEKSKLEEPRIKIFRGSQDDPEFLRRVAQEIGQIDVVIDDGSHVNAHVLASYQTLFPLLSSDGIYAIEDMQTTYWPAFGGTPDATGQDTSVALIKRLIDGLNWEEIPNREPTPSDPAIRALHVYHNLAFIIKGDNQEGTRYGNDKAHTG